MKYIDSCEYSELNKHSRIINSVELGQCMTVRLNGISYLDKNIYQIDDLSKRPIKELLIENNIQFDGVHPWVDIPITLLDVTAGYHLYKIYLINPHNMKTETTFFTYTIQDDDPYKGYIYMKNRYNVYDPTKDGMYREEEDIEELLEGYDDGFDWDTDEEVYPDTVWDDNDFYISDDIDPILSKYFLDED